MEFLFVVLGVLDQNNILAEHPLIEFIVFQNIWVIGCVFIYVAYGLADDSRKNCGRCDA
jgi:hypothetical protein